MDTMHSQIEEADGTLVEICGYRRCNWKTTLNILGYIATIGFLRIFSHWFPWLMLKFTHNKCPLHQARIVLIKDSCGVYHTVNVQTHKLTVLNNTTTDVDASISHAPLLPGGIGEGEYMFFIYKKMKYLFSSSLEKFIILPGWENRPLRDLISPRPLTQDTVERSIQLFGSNDISIRLTPIMKLLLTECLSPFYCFQLFSCVLWYINEYDIYASCIVIMSTVSLCAEVYEIRRNERALKQTISGSSTISCCRQIDGVTAYRQTDSIDLVPGDLIEIPKNGCLMPCDALLLSGSCIVNESTLTGESVPITKTAISGGSDVEKVFSIKTHARHVLFSGTSVIQTRYYADERVVALVLRTGFHTTKGELVRCILYPKPMRFKFTQDIHKVLLGLAVVAAAGFGYSIYLMIVRGRNAQEIIIRALDVITIVIPPALPAVMTVGTVFAQRRLRQNGIYCIHPSAINVCSAINIICFDKTGTLTESGIDLWGVVQSKERNFDEPEFDPSKLERGPLLEAMAACHSLTRIDGVLSGDPLDLNMFQSTKWELIEEISTDHHKFDMIVPVIVRPMDSASDAHEAMKSEISSEMFPYEVGIIRQFPFTSNLQRMSVVARVLNGSHFSVYIKGAPETIESLCRPDTIPVDFHSTLLAYTREGYRVLAVAWRPLKLLYTQIMHAPRTEIEHDLQFLGLIIMENRLKPETTPVISELIRASIRPIMVTGDNMLTALSVARDCEIIGHRDRIILVSAKPPTESVLPAECATRSDGGRSTTDQPSVVKISNASLTSASYSATNNVKFVAKSFVTPLVEFHYAEDLHKPVTEITTTIQRPSRDQNAKHRRLPYQPTQKMLLQSGDNVGQPVVILGDGSHSTVLCPSGQLNGSESRVPPSNAVQSTPDAEFSAASLPHSFTISVQDSPDFHLAITGKIWAIINQYYPWLIPKLIVKGAVFARFSPEQKAQLVEALQSLGYFVAMCGDGANDCGALKAAHAGISLSEAEASVASPFTSKQHNVSCVPSLIREGRCALATSFSTFKFMMGYSFIQLFSVTLIYYMGTNLSDWQYLYIDFFLLIPLSITFGFTGACKYLSIEPPTIRLLSFIPMMSLSCQLLISFAVQILLFVTVRYQPWYFPLYTTADEEDNANYENTVVFNSSVYQYVILAIVFSTSSRYRRSLITNKPFVVSLGACFVFNLLLTGNPFEMFLQEFELLRLPSTRFVILLHAIVLTNLLLSWLLELALNGMAFRRSVIHIRKFLFPKRIQQKAYEHICDELHKLSGIWPPIIRSSSIQHLPRDLFTDGNASDSCIIPTEQRTHNLYSHSVDKVEAPHSNLCV